MNALGDVSPTLGPTQLAAGNAPPTPPHENALDDIYGSAPASPTLAANIPHAHNHEILSDLPSRQRALDTDAYREGLANSKGQYVQEGFDEGYSLGATATCDALPRLTGDSFRAVKAVFLIGNPEHKAGLDSNVDSLGGGTTKNSNGILVSRGGIPEEWVSKTMDVCEFVSRSVVLGESIHRNTC